MEELKRWIEIRATDGRDKILDRAIESVERKGKAEKGAKVTDRIIRTTERRAKATDGN